MATLPITKARDELDPDSEQARLLFDPSPEWTARWIEHFLTVPNEIGQIVRMQLYPQQHYMLRDETGRDVIVKGRQTRCSSLKMAQTVRIFTTGQVYGATCVMGAQDDATTAVFRQRIRHHILNDLPMRGIKLNLVKDNDDELVIADFENRIQFVSGEMKSMSRGYAVQRVHLSELAHWSDKALELIGGILPAVPSPPYGSITFESTPKGESGAFYKYAMGARPFNPKDEFSVWLYPWWNEPRYRVSDEYYSNADIKLTTDELAAEVQGFEADEYEKRLLAGDNHDRTKLSIEQILWRRRKKVQQDKTKAPFLQEYPEDLDTCWLGVQGKFFDTPDGIDHLQYYRDERREPVRWYNTLPYKGDQVPLYNGLAVWEEPNHMDTYVMGFDVAGGGLNEDSDWSVLYVISVKKEKIVARLRVRCAPDTFGAMCCAVGTYYKSAVCNGERSHHGAMVFKRMREMGYPAIYYHTDPFKPQPKNKIPDPGMYPTEDTRREVLEKFKTAVTNSELMSYCKELVREMGTFTWQKVQQRLKAQALDVVGAHDDTIFAAAYAWYIVHKVRLRLARHEDAQPVAPVTVGRHGLVMRGDFDNELSQLWRGI